MKIIEVNEFTNEYVSNEIREMKKKQQTLDNYFLCQYKGIRI